LLKAAVKAEKISQTKIFPSETFFRHFSSFESIVEMENRFANFSDEKYKLSERY
jgi:hypothetical protein